MFSEKTMEYSRKAGTEMPVIKSGKYEESKAKAIDLINKGVFGVLESDFWILKNEDKSGRVYYTGLIISHDGCLKINDRLSAELKYRPECLSVDKDGYSGSLVVTYCCPEQGIYEVGEVNKENCRIAYPYAMAVKRCIDRVILKNSKLAYSGIYSEVEADEFRRADDAQDALQATPKEKTQTNAQDAPQGVLRNHTGGAPLYFCEDCNKVITTYKGNDGKDVTPEEHTKITRKYYGKNLCYDCAVKMKNAKS